MRILHLEAVHTIARSGSMTQIPELQRHSRARTDFSTAYPLVRASGTEMSDLN
jgi:hypothetical protein